MDRQPNSHNNQGNNPSNNASNIHNLNRNQAALSRDFTRNHPPSTDLLYQHQHQRQSSPRQQQPQQQPQQRHTATQPLSAFAPVAAAAAAAAAAAVNTTTAGRVNGGGGVRHNVPNTTVSNNNDNDYDGYDDGDSGRRNHARVMTRMGNNNSNKNNNDNDAIDYDYDYHHDNQMNNSSHAAQYNTAAAAASNSSSGARTKAAAAIVIDSLDDTSETFNPSVDAAANAAGCGGVGVGAGGGYSNGEYNTNPFYDCDAPSYNNNNQQLHHRNDNGKANSLTMASGGRGVLKREATTDPTALLAAAMMQRLQTTFDFYHSQSEKKKKAATHRGGDAQHSPLRVKTEKGATGGVCREVNVINGTRGAAAVHVIADDDVVSGGGRREQNCLNNKSNAYHGGDANDANDNTAHHHHHHQPLLPHGVLSFEALAGMAAILDAFIAAQTVVRDTIRSRRDKMLTVVARKGGVEAEVVAALRSDGVDIVGTFDKNNNDNDDDNDRTDGQQQSNNNNKKAAGTTPSQRFVVMKEDETCFICPFSKRGEVVSIKGQARVNAILADCREALNHIRTLSFKEKDLLTANREMSDMMMSNGAVASSASATTTTTTTATVAANSHGHGLVSPAADGGDGDGGVPPPLRNVFASATSSFKQFLDATSASIASEEGINREIARLFTQFATQRFETIVLTRTRMQKRLLDELSSAVTGLRGAAIANANPLQQKLGELLSEKNDFNPLVDRTRKDCDELYTSLGDIGKWAEAFELAVRELRTLSSAKQSPASAITSLSSSSSSSSLPPPTFSAFEVGQLNSISVALTELRSEIIGTAMGLYENVVLGQQNTTPARRDVVDVEAETTAKVVNPMLAVGGDVSGGDHDPNGQRRRAGEKRPRCGDGGVVGPIVAPSLLVAASTTAEKKATTKYFDYADYYRMAAGETSPQKEDAKENSKQMTQRDDDAKEPNMNSHVVVGMVTSSKGGEGGGGGGANHNADGGASSWVLHPEVAVGRRDFSTNALRASNSRGARGDVRRVENTVSMPSEIGGGPSLLLGSNIVNSSDDDDADDNEEVSGDQAVAPPEGAGQSQSRSGNNRNANGSFFVRTLSSLWSKPSVLTNEDDTDEEDDSDAMTDSSSDNERFAANAWDDEAAADQTKRKGRRSNRRKGRRVE